jgi:Uma2 family endonuclease
MAALVQMRGASMVTVSAASIPPGEYVPTADRRICMHGVSWDTFQKLTELRGETKPRVTYLEGTLELMSPSPNHEQISRRLARVIEEYLEQMDIPYEAVGAWLVTDASAEAALEPDECYVIGDVAKPRPDLALEVIWTSGGIAKLEVYRRLGIREVWFWKQDQITFHVLVGNAYEERITSELVPQFDRKLACEMLELPSLHDVRRALRERLG